MPKTMPVTALTPSAATIAIVGVDAGTGVNLLTRYATSEPKASPMDAPTQHRFLEGLDDIGITLGHTDAIAAYESSRPSWLASS